eukprot:SAG11_NODE_2946_length_2820_cov_2.023153_1_plen_127_part_10
MNMEHRQQLKNSMYEGSARVPLIISGPGYRANQVVTNLTSLLDLYPTFADIVGAPKPSFLSGYSLLPFLEPAAGMAQSSSRSEQRPDFVVSQYHSNMGNTGSFMIRLGPWKYIAFGQYGPAWLKDYT